MFKWFVYIVLLLVCTPGTMLAKTIKTRDTAPVAFKYAFIDINFSGTAFADTVKINKSSVKPDLKVKEVPKPKRQPKPEKVDEPDAKKAKPKRQRRPDGMDRPPEIPRRNDN